MGLKIGRKQTTLKADKLSPLKIDSLDRPFQAFVKDYNETGEGILPLLNKIEDQGERLAQSLTVKDLRIYKQLVQQFIRETVAGSVTLKSTRVWHRPQSHAHAILQVVDQTLIQLTDEILKRDVDQVAILQHIGEIKGLLIDLYQ